MKRNRAKSVDKVTQGTSARATATDKVMAGKRGAKNETSVRSSGRARRGAKNAEVLHAPTSAKKATRSPQELLDELIKSPTEHANNLPALLALVSAHAAGQSDQKEGDTSPSVLKSIAGYIVDRQYAEWGNPRRSEDTKTANDASEAADDGSDVYRKWLIRQREAFVSALLRLMTRGNGDGAEEMQVTALRCLMELSRSVSESNGLGSFDHVLYERVLRAVCEDGAGVTSELVGSVIDTYCGQYADVHYTTCKVLAKISKEAAELRADNNDSDDEEDGNDDGNDDHGDDHGDEGGRGGALSRDASASTAYCLRTVYDILLNITDVLAEFDDDALASWCGASEVGILATTNDGGTKRQRKKMREDIKEGDREASGVVRAKWSSRKLRQRAVSDAWIEFLKSQVPFDCYRSLLTRLHNTIIPALINPLLLSDFLTHALNRGGMDGMLALNGIFILVTQHGLEYPKFYQRLYGLLNADVFLSKHRVRFFRLADIFLASPMVPAYTAAAFAKKFARLGIRGSPSTAVIAIAFIHNIIRRHPSCVQILNRPESMRASASGGNAEVWRGVDVYDEHEEDPSESRALESSLWEISVFRNHADSTVAQFARTMLEKDMTNKVKSAEVDISEVLGMSYASLFDKEIKRRLKGVSTTVYAGTRTGVPQQLFGRTKGTEDGDDGAEAPAPFPGFVLV